MAKASKSRGLWARVGVALLPVASLVVLGCAEAPPPPPAPPPPAVTEAKPAVVAAPAKLDLSYWQNRADLLKAPPPPAPVALKLPPVERWKLKNGLEVIVVPRKELPVATFSLAIKAGAADDDKDHLGVSAFTASMLRKGTKKRKADDISKAIDFVGGSLDAGGGSESTNVDCTALSKDRGLCLDLLADVVLSPTFPQEEMGEIADQMVAALKGRYDSPGALAGEHFDNLIFGDRHPDGRVMNPEDVQKIKRADLVEFWNTFYRPNNAILAVAGDVEVAALKKDLEKAFGRWSAGTVPKREMPPIPERKGTQILLIDKPDLTQSTVIFGHKGIKHADPAFYAATMMNYVLGGSDFSSRLTRIVRAEKGLTYGIGSGFGAPLYEGAFRVSTSTKTESTWQALVAAVDEMRRMKMEGPTEDELAKGRGFYAGSYPFRLQSAQGVAASIVGAELHGMGVDYVRDYAVRMGAVDVAAAKDAAAKLLSPDTIVIVMIGNAEAIAKQIPPELKYERIGYKDPISYGVRRAARKKAAEAANSGEGAKALALITKAVAAHGGEKALRAIKDMTITVGGTLKMPDGSEADLLVNSAYLLPGKLHVVQEVMTSNGTQKIEFIVNPAGAKMAMGGGTPRPVPPGHPLGALLKGALFEDNNLVLVNLLDAKPAMQLAPAVTDGARKLVGVALKNPSGAPLTIYFDESTGMLARIVSQGLQGEKTSDFGDYRAVGGVKVAYQITETEGGPPQKTQVKDFKINAGVDAKRFE